MQHVIASARLVLRPVHLAEAAELHALLVHEEAGSKMETGEHLMVMFADLFAPRRKSFAHGRPTGRWETDQCQR